VPELETRLHALAAEVAFPPTPALAAAVEARLESQGAPRRRLLGRRQLVIALAVLVAAFAAVLAASPGARSAFLELFGIKGATVFRVERAPEIDRYLPLVHGEAVSLAEARRQVDFELLVPETGDGRPIERVFLDRIVGAVSFVYCCPSLILTQFRGEALPYVQKFAGPGTRVEEVTVDGGRGIWLEGAHAVVFRDASGIVRQDELRLAGNVLLWERGDVTLRLEGDLSRDEALDLAARVH
jgi:hypothetical protein